MPSSSAPCAQSTPPTERSDKYSFIVRQYRTFRIMKLATISLFGLAVAMSEFRFACGDQCPVLEAAVEEARVDVETASSNVEEARQAVVDAEEILDQRTADLAAAQQEFAGCRGWTPTVGQTWNYHLNVVENLPKPGEVTDDTPEADVYMIDMDSVDVEDTIEALHSDGKYAVCYISIGTWEPWRADKHEFPQEALKNSLADWPDEQWIDIGYTGKGETDKTVMDIMKARVDRAASLGCDGIEPDNMSVAFEDSGYTGIESVTQAKNLEYNVEFVEYVKSQGMKVAMKNLIWETTEVNLKEHAQNYDFAIVEECAQYNECGLAEEWNMGDDVSPKKPVFHVEYRETGRSSIRNMCSGKADSDYKDFATIVKTYPLWGPYCTCDESNVWRCARSLNRNF
ncbi:unnamed protein product [Ectocarpus sp. 4 AP-2014]